MELPLAIFGFLNEITTGKFMNDMLNVVMNAIFSDVTLVAALVIDSENLANIKREEYSCAINDLVICFFALETNATDTIEGLNTAAQLEMPSWNTIVSFTKHYLLHIYMCMRSVYMWDTYAYLKEFYHCILTHV